MAYYTEEKQYVIKGFNDKCVTVFSGTVSAMDKCTALMLAKRECTFNGKAKWIVKKADKSE